MLEKSSEDTLKSIKKKNFQFDYFPLQKRRKLIILRNQSRSNKLVDKFGLICHTLS